MARTSRERKSMLSSGLEPRMFPLMIREPSGVHPNAGPLDRSSLPRSSSCGSPPSIGIFQNSVGDRMAV